MPPCPSSCVLLVPNYQKVSRRPRQRTPHMWILNVWLHANNGHGCRRRDGFGILDLETLDDGLGNLYLFPFCVMSHGRIERRVTKAITGDLCRIDDSYRRVE